MGVPAITAGVLPSRSLFDIGTASFSTDGLLTTLLKPGVYRMGSCAFTELNQSSGKNLRSPACT